MSTTMMQSILPLILLVAAGVIQFTKGQISTEPWNEQYRICGLNYTDVLENCNTNPTCLTGDSCPAGFVCYQLNEDLCPRPTSAPSTVPSAAPHEPPSVAPSVALTTAKPSQSPTLLTVAPTTPNRFFCATSWEVVDETCSTATPCPNGQRDCTIAGMTCYQIQADKCVRKSTSSPTVGAILTSAPSPSSGSSFASKAPSVGGGPSGADQTTGSSFARPNSSPKSSTSSPTSIDGFVWTTPAPNGSSTLTISFFLKTILVAASVIGASLAMF